ncbi:hypothetical protein G7Z17_g746 [Cylindrodendrum hubeiense]|uniref:Uncharacterized protein n=1 Tax=Cylindrodendrum hubeiense TaxID=595255 RepID=A0A9P5HRR3_9HYPO|nr:hypothetical protein G7Z17_g746 [Cylindrodendrum hubeiense]
MDTVPPHIPLRIEGDIIYGRGSCDDKGPLAAQIIALQELRAEGLVRRGDVSLLFVVGEEKGGAGMLAVNDMGLAWEAAIFGEPTEGKLATGHKGHYVFELFATGTPAHSGYPEKGHSAILTLLAVLNEIKSLELPISPLLGSSTFNCGKISGGVAYNILPADAYALCSIRVATDLPGIEQKVTEIVDNHQGVELKKSIGYPEVLLDHDIEGLETMSVSFGTDVPRLKGTHKEYLYGPGSILDAHGENEHVLIPDLIKSVELIATAMWAVWMPQANTESTFSPARPPAAPLAVRSPYLNVWLNGNTDGTPSGYLPGSWPKTWSEVVQGWQGLIRVDGRAYNWMGNSTDAIRVEQVSLEYTSTKTIFTMNVDDKIEMAVTFLSPVYYDDLRRQSVTSSYLEVAVRSLDSNNHIIQVYCDVSGEWASGDNSAVINWETDSKDGVRYHKFFREKQDIFQEVNEIPSWGNWYWATGNQTGEHSVVRNQFTNNGLLTGYVDDEFRAIRDRWPVFGLAHDLGNVGSTSKSALFTIGYTQEEAIQFQGQEKDIQSIQSLWKEFFAEDELVTFFYKDYDYATKYSDALDSRVSKDSKAAAGQDYLTITSLAVRQVWGALQYTNTENRPLVFLKEISSNSDIQTADVIFPAIPIFLYFNPDIIKYTLDPLLENDRYHYPNKYAQHDLGTFPIAKGYPEGDDEAMPLEECGNMIIMMLAYAQWKGDNDYLSDNWDLLSQWAGFLIEEAKIPAEQLSTDDFAGHLANQTNLAIKGIIGLEAMSKIASMSGHEDQASNYSNISKSYYAFWYEHGVNKDADPKHSMLQYNNSRSHGLLYNIYLDKLLGLDLIPQSVYDMQSDFYLTIQTKYGVVLDTRGTLTKLDWELFAAAVAKAETQSMFIRTIAKWINETTTWRAFTDLYDAVTGGYPRGIQFAARPVQGGVFSLLALESRPSSADRKNGMGVEMLMDAEVIRDELR